MESFITVVVERHEKQASRLLEMLREIQAEYNHVSDDAIALLATKLAIPRTQIISCIEFYSFLHRHYQGNYEILLSDSITDHMLGKQALTDYLADKLGIQPGQHNTQISLNNTSCTGLCDQGPAALINGHAIAQLNRQKIDQITALIQHETPLSQWPSSLFEIQDNIQQPGLVMKQPITAGDSLKALLQCGLEKGLAEIERSGLRGRGGAGFKTAFKWRFCAETDSTERFVVCNADEGEPGTFKDRVLLNRFADQVFEGMTLCAAIIGAKQGFLYLRGEYLFLYPKLQNILQQRRQQGLLGNAILGRDFAFDIEIRLGAGAYICGEESALIESLEGKPGIPRNRPPYPVTQGYLGQPTVVNNVETFLSAAAILVYGADWFTACGSKTSPGSKILSICGDCASPGIYEYAFGVTIREILNDCGARDVLGVQVGGPSGSFISADEFDRKLAFEDLATGGSFIIFNQQRDLLDIVQNFTHFFAHESCGFCTPCRVGTRLLQKQLDKICDGHGSAGDVAELEKLCQLVKSTSHCGLGQTAANPILTTLQRYPERYEQRLKAIRYEPGFDLDAELEIARQLTGRDDPGAHLSQTGESS
ncbi:NADH-ubiquinone oxidoreductase-F iron-sulfur binding region domain-containing protein [methane-oxidizing endosymbiont of Gigantopelta aegis]|uniref:NADH-ubiquinone oxidoreductase-F iron-sulfur binding region domain-containing protein n=1 Tax=methane-oxidizing endosymbiont of Gigantopelta aegis TaxID=2794938 RepID=UPI0018DC9A56|nr:NADH-ubiquinone oxidoreductase-F iron-sulfur binding region domain-containing protein [methane-oxidizing endosymbiont of Gigantopelta aegis]